MHPLPAAMTTLLIALLVVLAAAAGGWRVVVARRRATQARAQATREQATRAAHAAVRERAPSARPATPGEAEAARATARAKAQRVIAAEQARRKAAIQKAQNAARVDAERRAKEAEATAPVSTLPVARLPKVERTTPIFPKAPAAAANEPAKLPAMGEKTTPLLRPAPVVTRKPEIPMVLKTAAQTLVLLVDDSKMVRVKSTRLLSSHQFQVMTAVDGVDALKQLENCCPDIVITDVDMPGMDGFALVNALRGNPRTQHIPIVMITSAEDRHREEALRVGVGLVLGKPYDEAALVAHIRGFKFFARADEVESLACA